MGDLNDRHTVDEAAGILWQKSAHRIFAVGPAGWLPIDGSTARHFYFIIATDGSGEVQFDRIPLEGRPDYAQMRQRFIEAIKARGSMEAPKPCEIHGFGDEAGLIKFCAATWPGELA